VRTIAQLKPSSALGRREEVEEEEIEARGGVNEHAVIIFQCLQRLLTG
jgi:hypothetical protein